MGNNFKRALPGFAACITRIVLGFMIVVSKPDCCDEFDNYLKFTYTEDKWTCLHGNFDIDELKKGGNRP